MPLTDRRRRKTPNEKLPEGPRESSAQVMTPMRMKLRVRRSGNEAGDAGAAAGGGQPEEEEESSRETGGRSRRKKKINNPTTTAATINSASSPPSSSTSAQAVMAAEEASPDSKCPICLDRFNNLAYLDRCLHRFCFSCIQEWSHNKAECPLCKQPFASILHSVRAEDDFKEYTLRPAPANSSVAATVAMVAAMASAARSSHQMRLMLRRHRGADAGETTTRRQRRERGGSRVGERTGVWAWYLHSPPLALPPLPPHPPVVAEDSEEGGDLEEQRGRGGAHLTEYGVIFEGLREAVAPLAPNDRESRRLMTRLAARQQLQQEGGSMRRLREREMVAFRRALYRCGIQVRGVAGVINQGQQQRDLTAESFHQNPTHLNRLRPWLQRELTVLYGAHGSLVDIVQRIIMARLARHGLEDTPTIEEELRPFLLARTEHFMHELVSFARSPLSLENYDLQAVYEPPAAALDLDGVSSSSDSSSVIAISEVEEEEGRVGGRSEERLPGRTRGAHDDIIQTGSCLSLSAWDDETPGPSYSTAEPSCSLASLSFSPASKEPANEEGGAKQEEGEEECLIVGYKKPIAERTPELVQLSSSDTEEEEDKEKKKEEDISKKLPALPSTTPPLPSPIPSLSYLPTIPPSTSHSHRNEQKEKDNEAGGCRSRARSWSGSSNRSRKSVCTLSPTTLGVGEQQREKESCRDRRRSASEAAREKRKRKRSRRGWEKSGDRLRKRGTLYNPNRSIYPPMMCQRSHSPSPFHSSVESGSPLTPSPTDSSWEYPCSHISPLTSSPFSSHSSSSSPQPWTRRLPSTSTSTDDRSSAHHGEKPGGKRKYKSRHLDNNDKDPTWRPSSSHRREMRKEMERRRRRDEGRRKERQRKDAHRDRGGDGSRRCREDRSPSVEIIYEGTILSSTTEPPAHKRRRKRHRRTQRSSSPVIITLDSDSSHDVINNRNSSSSSPVSSQQTVDFSDLPPLPLLNTTSVGGTLNADIGELPIDILDHGSNGSDTEPAGQSEAPITVYNSDHDVDVENVEESGSLLGSDDGEGPMRTVDGGTRPKVETGVVFKRDSEVSASDSNLLATILNDLKGIAAPKCDLSLSSGPRSISDTRKKSFRAQCEVSLAHSNQDHLLAKTRLPNPDLPDGRDQHQGIDLFHSSILPLPPVEQLKEFRVREEGKDLPPLLKRASPVRSYDRNTPPPLKHKDAGSPRFLSGSPVDLCSPHTGVDANPAGLDSHDDITCSPVDSHLGAELPKETIPPISTLKRPFRGELASAQHGSATDMCSSSRLAPLSGSIHSRSLKPHNDLFYGFESSSTCADGLPHPDCHSSKLHSSLDDMKDTLSSTDSHPVNSLSSTDFHSAKTGWSKDGSVHPNWNSKGYRNKTLSPNSFRGAPTDLQPCSSVSAHGFSGANCTDSPATVHVPSIDSRTHNPSPPTDFHPLRKVENLPEKVSPSPISLAPTVAVSVRLLPTDVLSRSPKSTVDLHPSNASSRGLTDVEASSSAAHEERLAGCHPVHPGTKHPSNFVSTMMGDQVDSKTAHRDSRIMSSSQSETQCCSSADPRLESQSPKDKHWNKHKHLK